MAAQPYGYDTGFFIYANELYIAAVALQNRAGCVNDLFYLCFPKNTPYPYYSFFGKQKKLAKFSPVLLYFSYRY